MSGKFPDRRAVIIIGGILAISSSYFVYANYLTVNLNADGAKTVREDAKPTTNVFVRNSSISILNFGDAMFGRQVGKAISEGLDPFEYIKSGFATTAEKYDAVILNLEGPITGLGTKCQIKPYSFKFASSTAKTLRENNIFAVNLANNHSLDCYNEGREETRKYLEAEGVGYFGGSTTTEAVLTRNINGQKVSLLGIDVTANYSLSPQYEKMISNFKKSGNLVLVHIHWGEEYRATSTPNQREVARKLIDAGADAVIGHHPHIIENMEFYKGKPIFYSLGNFIFDQISNDTNRGIGVGITFNREASSTATIYPYEIKKHRPLMYTEEKANQFCKTFAKQYISSSTTPCVISY